MIHIAGGVYTEFCHHPLWNQVWGSGGRAAFALTQLLDGIELHTYARAKLLNPIFEQTARANAIQMHVHASKTDVQFEYWFPQSPPTVLFKPRLVESHTFKLQAECVLRFGMLEGDAIVTAKGAVYDPQNGDHPISFWKNGSTAERLALVLNHKEARVLSGRKDPVEAARYLVKHERASAVVIKCGPLGAYITEGNRTGWAPCYKTPDVWPLGSGDVFSAVFAAFWLKKRYSAISAAGIASKATALYCTSRSLPVPLDIERINLNKQQITACKKPDEKRAVVKRPRVYLAGPFFKLSEVWLIERVRESLQGLGLSVFSPLHDVGYGSTDEVAGKDLTALSKSDVVFAIIGPVDAGTLYEIGFARSRKIPVVAFVDHVQNYELTMLTGTGCDINTDLSTALYKTAWVALKL